MFDTHLRNCCSRRRLFAALRMISSAIVLLAMCAMHRSQAAEATGDDCAQALGISRKVAPLAKGELAALTMATKPLRLPDLTFQDVAGNSAKLSAWRGRTVLVNLWATWCVPCRKEMPALDNLQVKLGGPNFQVVAINVDTGDSAKSKAFMKDGNLTHLEFFNDQKAKVFQDLKSIGLALGMPTSVLIDGAGCEIAAIAGPAEWDSDDAIRLITAASAP
jgi:thiol-disulfide isomerase/thioredoxin